MLRQLYYCVRAYGEVTFFCVLVQDGITYLSSYRKVNRIGYRIQYLMAIARLNDIRLSVFTITYTCGGVTIEFH